MEHDYIQHLYAISAYINPCALGEAEKGNDGRPRSCTSHNECSNGFWCHIGAVPQTTVCCPGRGICFVLFLNVPITLTTKQQIINVGDKQWTTCWGRLRLVEKFVLFADTQQIILLKDLLRIHLVSVTEE